MFVLAAIAPTSASTDPPWIAVSGTVSAMITAAGVIFAGLFAFFKFSKGRTFRPRCSIHIEPKLIEIGGSRAIEVSVTVRNDGLVALLFPSDTPQRLLVGQADAAIWKKARDRQWPVVWEKSSIPRIRYSLAVPDGNSLEIPKSGTTQTPPPPWWGRLNRRWLLRHLRGDTLEPGEEWARSALVPVSSEGVAYLLRARVSACRHVGVRHVMSHRRRCCRKKSPGIIWTRDVYLLPAGK